jgi:hypothetical protein
MSGQVLYVDPSGYLYMMNANGSITYLTGRQSGRTVILSPTSGTNANTGTSGANTGSLNLASPNRPSGVFIMRDDAGAFILSADGSKRYLTLSSS